MDDNYILQEMGYSKEDIYFEKYNKKKLEKIKLKIGDLPPTKFFKRKAFWNRVFYTDKNTHDPRQESELFIEVIKKEFNNNEKILFYEMGVGTGCIINSLLEEFPNSIGFGIDISKKALKIALKNTNTNRLILSLHDIKKPINNIMFNGIKILISNPPYLMKNEINHQGDPYISLYGGEEGLDFYYYLNKHIKHFDFCYFEIPPNKTDEIKKIFNVKKVYKDLLGLNRLIKVSKHIF